MRILGDLLVKEGSDSNKNWLFSYLAAIHFLLFIHYYIKKLNN